MAHLQVLLQFCVLPLLVSTVLQPPRNLQLSSQNFQHILTWEDPNNESEIVYNVQYSINYRPPVPTRDCTNVSVPRCDLTKDFLDIRENYGAQIQILSHNDSSIPTFSPIVLFPISDTLLGPPIVDLHLHDDGIQVTIRPPISHLWSEKEQQNVTMLSNNVYPVLFYTINLVNSTQALVWETEVFEEIYTIILTDVLGQTNYCVSVNASSVLNRHSIASPMKCIFTHALQVKGDRRIYFIVFIIVVIILLVGLALFTNIIPQAGSACRKHILTPNVLESFPRLKRFLDNENEFSPLVYIPMEVIGTESGEEKTTEQEKDANISSITANNGITV